MRTSNDVIRPLAGLGMVVVVIALVATAIAMFTGATSRTDTVTVQAPRAGLVMDVDAKVQLRGVTVGRVAAIRYDNDDTATIKLAMEPDQLERIPANVGVSIAAPTVFGAKSVELVMPSQPSGSHLRAGQHLSARDVAVEVNTVFQDLTEVLAQIRPAELNSALSAIATGLNGHGDALGQTLVDMNTFLGRVNSQLPSLRALLRQTPDVMKVYADSSLPLLNIMRNTSTVSDAVVTDQQKLDAFLTSVIGLSDTGKKVLGDNGSALAKVLRLLVPTTALTDEYSEALNCSLEGFADLAVSPPADVPGLGLSANFLWGIEPYNMNDLPKVGAKGGPQCMGMPIKYQQRSPFLIADTGADKFHTGRKSLQLNTESLHQMLFGPITDGAPR
ncbi:MCE family protein [Gordonia amarae]|uniref:MCE family protein n=1 Tax=Gordonia amarae TaxID=36821 RepID=A0A857L129_9ACTN|nr:MCE family protein [Gordonia amarae]MCS3880437.1 virulence factor Mce-like protein [Gordonia amarae]QHN18771.1 MCE family protein [Gordonia amarae]QHN23246.1 MCE family protein [Gordonia amarae]QHN32148.1 MCE family protein [Gordonia amarae]QHN40894.1 MCE family protein [Gordonia amarae]